MKTIDKYTFFFKGPFSQWHMSAFVEKGVTYNCAEQYMMAQKALLFRDFDSYDKIMESTWQKEMQDLGRGVQNFDKEIWDNNKYRIVLKGNILKFTQDTSAQDLLLSTGDTILVEASPVDKVWGIGLSEDDPDCLDFRKWKGENLLGYAITDVKKTIRFFALSGDGRLEKLTRIMKEL
jgi:ribA/ribD-fused uncharacterized protein